LLLLKRPLTNASPLISWNGFFGILIPENNRVGVLFELLLLLLSPNKDFPALLENKDFLALVLLLSLLENKRVFPKSENLFDSGLSFPFFSFFSSFWLLNKDFVLSVLTISPNKDLFLFLLIKSANIDFSLLLLSFSLLLFSFSRFSSTSFSFLTKKAKGFSVIFFSLSFLLLLSVFSLISSFFSIFSIFLFLESFLIVVFFILSFTGILITFSIIFISLFSVFNSVLLFSLFSFSFSFNSSFGSSSSFIPANFAYS